MQIDQETRDGVLIVKVLQARVDLEVAPALKTALREAIEGGMRRIALDLVAVSFIDSSGLGAIVSAVKALGDSGRIAIAGAQGDVRDTLRLTRIDRIVPTHSSTAAAVAELSRE